MPLTIGVVIPCHKPNIGLLKRLLDSIENQTHKPDNVIVSCSSSKNDDIPYSIEHYSYPLHNYTHEDVKDTSENKNFGSRLIGTDIISYFDSDDVMHPQRIEIIYNAFITNSDLKLFLHGLSLNPTDFIYPIYDINSIRYELDPFYICQWGAVNLKDNSKRHITNGHLSILKEVFVELQYVETPDAKGCEDTLYNRTIINRYPNQKYVGYCDCELTWYFPNGTQGVDIMRPKKFRPQRQKVYGEDFPLTDLLC